MLKEEKEMEKNYRAELVGVFGDPVDGNPTGRGGICSLRIKLPLPDA